MKKLLTTLTLGLTLATGVAKAEAAFLANWEYNLVEVSLTNNVGNNISPYNFSSGNYNITLETNGGNSGDLTLAPGKSASSQNGALVNQTSREDAYVETPSPGVFVGNLSFSYTANAVDDSGNDIFGTSMKIKYNLPLYTFSQGDVSYIFYNNDMASTAGSTAITFDGYKYGATGVGLFIDSRSMENFPGTAPGDTSLYSGWAINDDTMRNDYSKYVVGGTNNNDYFLRTKDFGKYVLSGVFSIAASEVPAPTPEPATMLLTGLGLAGLGAMKRRRKKVQ